MISVSALSSHTRDVDIVTDGTTTVYTFSIIEFSDGAMLLFPLSFTTSTTDHYSCVAYVHKQNNIGASVNVTSERSGNGMTVSFSATYTTITITLSKAVVGNLKISPVLLNQ